ncbi:MAG: glutaredoxin family protein [Actinomycetota bacterium]
MSRIVFYTRRGCPLCDKARSALQAAGLRFDEVDIGSDPGLEAEYGWTIPVVEVDGRPVFEAGMDPATLPEMISG